MRKNFKMNTISNFEMKVKIIHGSGAIEKIGEYLKGSGKTVLVITDPLIVKVGIWNKIKNVLDKSDISYKLFCEVEPEPSIEVVERAVTFFGSGRERVFLAIGGGSSIDTAKAVNMRLAEPSNKIIDFVGKNWCFKVSPDPIIAVPTTAGTGSEVGNSAVITNPMTKVKMCLVSDQILPSVSILDPDLLASIPSHVAAATGIDALTHAVESYLSNESTPLTESMSLAAIKLIGANLRSFVSDPRRNSDAREKMQLASTLAGLSMNVCGLGLDHALSEPLGGKYHISHGIACAICFLPILKYNYIASEKKYIDIGEALDPSINNLSKRDKGIYMIQLIKDLMDDIEIPYTMKSLGIKYEFDDKLVAIAMKMHSPKVNPRVVDRKILEKLFKEIT